MVDRIDEDATRSGSRSRCVKHVWKDDFIVFACHCGSAFASWIKGEVSR